MSDYDQIANVIHYLNEHFTEQPSLADMAAIAYLSPEHFQKKFSQWTGISPKAFVQTLTFNQARDGLQHGDGTIDASYDAGLSGPGRLYDLCVKLIAATPGEIKTRGQGLKIVYGYGKSPFGDCFLAHSERGIMRLEFIHDHSKQAIADLQATWPKAGLTRDDTGTGELLDRVFKPQEKHNQTLAAYVSGTTFQIKVWQALLEVPFGTSCSYGSLAKDMHAPRAARAVGSAIGANTLAYLIPCHRVIRETGVVGQYRWGMARKKFMLACESEQLRRAGQ